MAVQDNRGKLMWASFLTLIAAGMGFAVRAGVLSEWGNSFGFTQFELGTITGMGLTGFGVVIVLASLITDRIGYKAILLSAFALHVLSAVITLGATPIYFAVGKEATYWCLFIGVFIFAVANGLCEAAINPLIANLYPDKKTHYLNILHAGWPGGLVVGGILGLFLVGNVPWEIPLALYVIPTAWYGYLVVKESFPESDVSKAGIGLRQMLTEFASPILLFLLVLHACVGYVELGTDSWVVNITNSIVGQGFQLFTYASIFMFILRFFAGPIVERINPLGLLCISTVFGTIGLLLLGIVETVAMIWVAMTVYSLGKTFLWPTMLGIVGERFPRGGAITMGAIGGAGALSAGLLGSPLIGYKQDLYASKQLEQTSPAAYVRYAVDEEKGPFLLPKVKGLDGQKVGVLADGKGPAKTLNSDYAVFQKRAESGGEEIPQSLVALKTWWDETAAEHKDEDAEPVKSSTIYGGRMALTLTAAVPAFMFVGYLILFLHFKKQGGYRMVEIDSGGGPPDSERDPTASQATDQDEEGPSSG